MNRFNQYETVQIPINKKVYTLYVADDNEKRIKGLSKIPYLPKRMGMLFTYPAPVCHAFTMENTKIPLQIIFINESFEIIESVRAEAGQKEEVRPRSDFLYVIEIPV